MTFNGGPLGPAFIQAFRGRKCMQASGATLANRSHAQRVTSALRARVIIGAMAVAFAPASAIAEWLGEGMLSSDEWKHDSHTPPRTSPDVKIVPEHDPGIFGPDPTYEDKPYDFQAQLDIYGAKRPVPTQRPLLELGRQLYQYGPFQPAPTWLGEKNAIAPHLLVYGDWRTAIAYNNDAADQNGDGINAEDREIATVATRLNLEADLKLTATERIHAFFRPVDKGGQFTRVDFGGVNHNAELELDGNLDALFFEGDLGAMLSGLTGEHAAFDLPIAIGFMPLLFQNGVWVEDAFIGFAFTIPAQNSPALDISNYDITFFFGFDKVTTGAVPGADAAVQLFGVTAFLETMMGYWELGYAFTNDNSGFGGSYHNVAAAFTRRYGDVLSNSIRVIANFGQDPAGGAAQTADGLIILIENSFITSEPSTIVPYVNFFAGFDRPQSLARDAGAGGVLKNTGILFETDGLTGFPKMDDTGHDTYGVAAGIEFLFDLDKQLVFEAAALRAHGSPFDRTAPDDQAGVGVRIQVPINNAILLRFEAMYAWRSGAEDLAGIRFEYRWKF